MLIINTISRPVFFIRDDKIIETNNTGERITQEEFLTMISEKEVICVDEITGLRHTYIPGTPVVYTTAPESVVETQVEETKIEEPQVEELQAVELQVVEQNNISKTKV
jgi:hypothetical protein